MERYFQVTGQSNLYNEYMEYKNNLEVVRLHTKEFMDTQGIETDLHATQSIALYIVPTEKYLEKFSKQLCKPIGEGLRAFRSNSKVGKAWVNSLEEKQIKIKHKPFVGLSFKNCLGKNRSRILEIGSVVYCSFENEYNFNDTPKGMIEIKASEFWKIVEDYNAKNRTRE